MKKTIVVLLLTLGWLITSGQRQPILPYGHYSPRQVKVFANSNSLKAKQFSAYLLHKTGESTINSLFQKVVVKDTTLEAGSYQNSYWDVPTQEIKFFVGKKFIGEVTLYQNKIFETILYKDTCVNILNTRRRYFGLISEDQPTPVVAPPPSKKEESHDWRTYVVPVQPPPPLVIIEHSGFYKWQVRNGWWADPLVAIGVGFIAHDRNHQWYLWFEKGRGNPGGAITTTTTTDTGGPGGAPTTK